MHLEWGSAGLAEAGRLAGTVVVVDVLGFSTAVTVAAERGVDVRPLRPGHAAYARRVAERSGAQVVAPAGEAGAAAALAAVPAGSEVVLADGGGGLALTAGARGCTVLVGCLRNARAVAARALALEAPTLVVAAGDRWRAGGLRVAIEDQLGAGAILAAALDLAPATPVSPEAGAAVAAWEAARPHLDAALRESTSGQALVVSGQADELTWAGAPDVTDVVPVLADGRFAAAGRPRGGMPSPR